MGMKIIVENLPSDITEESLKTIFDQIGAVESVKINTDLLSRRPKGSGYVEMSLDVDAFRAVNCINGASIKNKRVSLKEAQPLLEQAKHVLMHAILPQVQNFGFSFHKEKTKRDH
ncbi:MAG TPA: RNA-binding protein [Nitrospirota bacterium]|nr:RNA-binding protein [Nitrospirota bacterium]